MQNVTHEKWWYLNGFSKNAAADIDFIFRPDKNVLHSCFLWQIQTLFLLKFNESCKINSKRLLKYFTKRWQPVHQSHFIQCVSEGRERDSQWEFVHRSMSWCKVIIICVTCVFQQICRFVHCRNIFLTNYSFRCS